MARGGAADWAWTATKALSIMLEPRQEKPAHRLNSDPRDALSRRPHLPVCPDRKMAVKFKEDVPCHSMNS
jgi:hypothetical protein